MLPENYKELYRKVPGVYRITNLVNGKIYIGSTTDIVRRWNDHISALKAGVHSNLYLQRSWDKYGEENFQFEVLETLPEDSSEDQVRVLEQKYLDSTCCYNREIGYK